MIEERRLFARLTLFTGMYFASTAVIPGGGDGGGTGDEGGDTGGGGDGTGDDGANDDASVGDETDDSSSEGDDSTDAEGVSEESDTTDDADDGTETATGTRARAEQIKKDLEKLRETDPEAAKRLRKEYFKQDQEIRGYRESFKTAAEAIAARDLIESIGGETGISELQGEVKEYATELSKMGEGDPSIVDDLARDFPKGLVKLTPHAVARLKQIDPAGYTQRIAAPGAVEVLNMTAGSLNGTTPLHAMERLIELIGDGKQEPASAMAKALRQWAADVQAYAKQAETRRLELDDDDPARKELESARAEVQTEKQKIFTQQASTAIMARLSRVVDQHLAPYLKKTKLTPQQKKSLHNATRNRITTMLEREPKYQAPFKAALAKGDIRAMERLVGSWANIKAKRAAPAEWAERGHGSTKTASANGDRPAVTTSSAKPRMEDVDWSKDPRRLRYTGNGITGEYTDKKGNVRRFKW